MTHIHIETVTDKKQLKRFITTQYSLYENDPAYIKPLMMERLDALSVDKNPYFEHAEACFFIAVEDGVDVGTISAQIDQLAQEKWGPNLGHFGLFEAKSPTVASALFKAAEDWLRQKGMKRMQGPWNLSSNQQCGMLADGFDTPPVIMMPHGKPDYINWTEDNGFKIVKKLLALETDTRNPFDPKTERIAKMARTNKKTNIRQIDMKNFRAELDIILDIFNDAWSDNWGFVPMTESEIEHMAKELKPIINPNTSMIAEYDGKPVAFMIMIPDVNHHIRDLDGKLFPFGVFKLLWRLLINKTQPRQRVPLMGLRKEMHGNRLTMAMMLEFFIVIQKYINAHGCEFAEMGWILEENQSMISMIEAVNGKVYKTYHIYEKDI